MRLDYKIDNADVLKGIKARVPGFVAKSINDLAYKAKEEAVAITQRNLIIRRKWVLKGFRIRRATANHPVAVLYHRDAYLGKQEFGGVDVPRKRRFIAVPVRRRPSESPKSASEAIDDGAFIINRKVYQRISPKVLRVLHHFSEANKYDRKLELAYNLSLKMPEMLVNYKFNI